MMQKAVGLSQVPRLLVIPAVLLLLSRSPCLSGESPGDQAAVTLDQHRQLFLDNYLVQSMVNVHRRVQTAHKYPGNPLIWATEPWEERINVVYGSIIRDGDKYRMWYKGGTGVAYAESDDGLVWTKPRLDLVIIDGQKTNLLFRKSAKKKGPDEFPYFYELFGVHKDPRDADPARRYRMGFLSTDFEYSGPREDPFHKGQRRGLGVAGSSDGIHWKLIDNFATEAICDGATHWMFDPLLDKYVLFGRTRKTLPEVEATWSKYDWYKAWHSGRAVARVESPDFVKWNFTDPATAPVVMTADLQDRPGTEIYSMKVFPYESLYIGLVQVFLALPDASVLDVQLAVSHDGMHFTRVGDRSPFIPLGPVGSWDRFNHSLANNSPIMVGDELRFYYGGRTYRHTPYKGKDTGPTAGGVGLATIQRDRFVALEASFDGGEITTRPLKLKGKSLHLNARSDFGEIVIEARDRAGKTVARSKPLRRDSLDTVVEWDQGSLDAVNSPVVLLISLRNACLFAVWCS
jgi:hypothetical protein